MITNPLIILAGGFGTRLSAVVADVPKPLAPVNGRPFLHYLLESWKKQGIRKFIFLVHHKADMMKDFVNQEQNSGSLADCDVQWIVEEEPMGTSGAVANAVHSLNISGDFFVANADTYMEYGVAELAEKSSPAIAIVHVENASRYGSLNMQNERVVSFEEKRPMVSPGYINAGLYLMHSDMFRNWDHKPFSMEKDVFEKMVPREKLNAVPVDSVFIDIGIPEDYHRFCKWIESDKKAEL